MFGILWGEALIQGSDLALKGREGVRFLAYGIVDKNIEICYNSLQRSVWRVAGPGSGRGGDILADGPSGLGSMVPRGYPSSWFPSQEIFRQLAERFFRFVPL